MTSKLAILQIPFVLLTAAPVAFAGPSDGKAGTTSSSGGHDHSHSHVNLLTGEGVSLGGVLFPHFHAAGVFGESSGNQAELATAHHDQSSNGWTIQSLEAGLSLRLNDHIEGFATGALRWDDEAGWSEDFEEGFLKLKDLPGGFDLRGGQYFNHFGLQNSLHQHGWDWVDQYLVSGRFFGEHGLGTIGGEITWELPFNSNSYTSLLSFSAGEAPEIAHEEHGEEEEGEEHEFEGEGAQFGDVVFAANWTNIYRYSDFHSIQAGLSGAWGDNAWGRDSAVYGLHAKYLWRENGLLPGGRELRWTNELFYRTFDAVSGHLPGEEEEHDEEEGEEEAVTYANLDEFGFYSSIVYGFDSGVAGPMEVGLRAEYVQGIDRAGQEERFRISPGLTWYLNDARTAYARLQYNYDDGSESGESHGFWLQFGLNWGGKEVR